MNQLQSGKLYKAGFKIVKLLVEQDKAAFFVGGFVRNNLLKLPSDNIDIATDATPDQIEEILAKHKIKVIPVGKKFGSILAIVDTFSIEITTFRTEDKYSDKRHPDQVEFIKEYLDDAQRRDFTINALYQDPITKQIFDPTNGMKDLKAKVLKFVGDPKHRIAEDPLRMLRGVRLATQLGFKLEKKSLATIKPSAKQIETVAGERIKAELDKILLSENRVAGLKLLDQAGLLKYIIPEMEAMKKFSHKSKFYHLEGSMFNHTMLALEQVKNPNLNLIYAVLFHDIAKPQVGKKVLKPEGWVFSTKGHADVGADVFLRFAKKIKFSRQSSDTVEWLIRKHMLLVNFWEMGTAKQIDLAMHPDFVLLLEHWSADHFGTKRAEGFEDHSQKFLTSISTGKKLLKQIKQTSSLQNKLAQGDLIIRHSKLKPGRELGQKILDVKVQIVLGKIKNESDLKNFLK